MKKRLLPLLLVTLFSCTSQDTFVLSDEVFSFSTWNYIDLYAGSNSDVKEIKQIFKDYSDLSDNYLPRSYTNVYTINNTNEELTLDERLYKVLQTSFSMDASKGTSYFNPLIGSLSKKWKAAIANKEALSQEEIDGELAKINSSAITFKENNVIQRVGDAEIDLGGIAKGYTLDVAKEYLQEKEIKNYIINAGYSSILLGEKKSDNGYFTVGIKDLNRAYFLVKNCVISTSGNSEQGEHIVNPITGQLANNYDTVIVIGEEGAHGDALSTSLMLSTIEEIQQIETEQNIKVLVIKNKSILYRSSGLEVYYR